MSKYTEPEPDVIYVIEEEDGSESYGVTPDGTGFYFYDTLEETYEQHGNEYPKAHLSAKEFEELRFGPEFDDVEIEDDEEY